MCGVRNVQFQIGDMVARKSYQMDVLFRIIRIEQTSKGNSIAILHGDEVRLIADSDFSDLVAVKKDEQMMRKRKDESRMNESLELLRQDYKLLREKQEYMRQANISIRSIISICRAKCFIWMVTKHI